MARFKDRNQAGRRLAEQLMAQGLITTDAIICALPRGGVPVAAPLAQLTGLSLDVLVAKKIGAPGHEEIAIGAITDAGPPLWNDQQIRRAGYSRDWLERKAQARREEVRRLLNFFRERIPAQDPRGRPVILVDDGLATGTTLELALRELRRRGAKEITVALPVAPAGTLSRLRGLAQHWIVLETPRNFHAVGDWYEDFTQVTNEEALRLLIQSQPGGERTTELMRLARPIESDLHLQAIAEKAATARVVVLATAVSGTRELSKLRRRLSQALIQDHGFKNLVIETDPLTAQDLGRWARLPHGLSLSGMLAKYSRWPRWLAIDEELPSLLEPLRKEKVQIFGLDPYAHFESRAEIRRLRGEGMADPQILHRLVSLLDSRLIRMGLGSPGLFDPQNNLRLLARADSFYTALLREEMPAPLEHDEILFETLQALMKNQKSDAKFLLWTDADRGLDSAYTATKVESLGHRLRKSFGPDQVCLIILDAGSGTRLASADWGETEEEFEFSNRSSAHLEGNLHEVAKTLGRPQIGLIFDKKSKQGPLGRKHPLHLGSVRAGYTEQIVAPASACDLFLYVDQAQALRPRPPVQLVFGPVMKHRQSKHLN